MSPEPTNGDSRLLVVRDLDRLGPIVADYFAPHRIDGVHTYLDAIAEIPRSPTRAVLVAHDPTCRNPESAVAAMKSVAGDVPVVICCEPAFEDVGRRLLSHGADAYVIYPPDAAELEGALGIPSRKTQQRWLATASSAPPPSAEEIARLAELITLLDVGSSRALDAMANLACLALDSERAMVFASGRSGHAARSRGAKPAEFDPVLVEPIRVGGKAVGQVRIGPGRRGGFSHDDTAKLRHYAALFGHLIEWSQRSNQWEKLALTDDLTGLPNRRRLLQFLEQTLAEAEQSRNIVTALVFDIDDFKRYNDSYGHDAGDQILIEVGRLFVQCCRRTDMVSRYGGDEFVVVFWDPEGPRTAGSRHPAGVLDVVQRFRHALRTHTFSRLGPEATGCLTISGGLAHYPWQARSPEGLIEAADQALLHAKEAGKNRFWLVGDGLVCE